jgi:hypothetical protein
MTTRGRECCRLAFAFFLFVGLSKNLIAQPNQTIPGCKDIAPLPPIRTFVGPSTLPVGANELAFAGGAWGNLFPAPCAHETGVDWFGRWKLGLTNRLDWGVDFEGTEHTNFQAFSLKIATRYQLFKNFRLENGIGIGDDTEGKSLNVELGATMGILPERKGARWFPYATVRMVAEHGRSGRSFVGSNVPDGALVPMGIFGASIPVGQNLRWVLEGGGGAILSQEHSATGSLIYFTAGLDFVVRRKK